MKTNHLTGPLPSVYQPLPSESSWRQAALRNRDKAARLCEVAAILFLFLFALVQPLSMAATHVAYAGATLFWILRLIFVRKGILRSSPLDLPILIYLLLCALSTLLSPVPASSWEGMRKINLIFLVVLVAHNVTSARRAKQLLVVLFLSGLVAVLWAGWQFAEGVGLRVHDPAPGAAFSRAGIQDNDVLLRVDGRVIASPEKFLQYLNSKPIDEPLRLRVLHGGGIEVLKDAVSVVVPAGEWPRAKSATELGMQVATARPARARAFYSHYVTYSLVMMLLASLVFGLWLTHAHRFSGSGLVLVGLLLAFGISLGMTLTRAAWLSLAVACAVQVWFYVRRWSLRLLLPLALIAIAIPVTSVAMHRWRGTGIVDAADPGTDYRLLMWRDGVRLIEQHPWTGVGMNTIRDQWWSFDLAAYQTYHVRLHFHSTPIQIAVEMGVLVLISWIVLMGSYLFLLVRLIGKTREGDRFRYGLILGILGGATGFLVSSLVQYDFGDSVDVFLFWFLAGLALAVHHQLSKTPLESARSPS